ncbi:MAG: DNA glycosylase [Pseudonocardiaceae bacterium]|nr:DNA glycosylase [Pseudonocardiaceae bacterium]
MPEGDVVFRTAHRLEDALSGKPLVRAELRHPSLSTVELVDRTVCGVRSVGKHLFIRFSGELSLHNHLRMDGLWQIIPQGKRWRRPAHQARVILGTADRLAVGFHLHELRLLDTKNEHRMVEGLGPDLLDPQWTDTHTETAVRAILADPEREISAALLDQRVMAGVGNLYSTEVCFLLGRTPWTPIGELSGVEVRESVELCRKLLFANAWRVEQSTTGQLEKGREHWVYGRGRQGCFRCGGPVRRAKHGSGSQPREAYFCPRCQTGPGPSATPSAT